MTTWTLILERTFGWTYLVMGFSLLAQRQLWMDLIQHVVKNIFAAYGAVVFALFLGLIVVQTHNIWVMRPSVLVTIFGWIIVAKSLTFFLAPKLLLKLVPSEKTMHKILPYESIVMILLSCAILYDAYL